MFKHDFKVTSTFESTLEAHEECPSSKVHWNTHEGQCDVHDEWFQLSDTSDLLQYPPE